MSEPRAKKPPAKKAIVTIRSAIVDCPTCDAAIYEPATIHDNIPWGKTIVCWSCREKMKLPRNPLWDTRT